jgi:hypothetical protein
MRQQGSFEAIALLGHVIGEMLHARLNSLRNEERLTLVIGLILEVIYHSQPAKVSTNHWPHLVGPLQAGKSAVTPCTFSRRGEVASLSFRRSDLRVIRHYQA